MEYRSVLVSAALMFGLAACGGGGGGGGALPDGLMINKSGSVASAQLPASYKFGTTQNHAYSARLVSTSGDADLLIATQPPNSTSTASLLGYSWSGEIDDLSFIVPSSMTLYGWVDSADPSSSYTLQVYHNHLSVDGQTRTRGTQSTPIYFSFDAVAGQAYNVKVTPSSGDPHLRVYTGAKSDWIFPAGLVPDSSTLVGTSDNTGQQAESIVFVAAETKTHYLAVTNTNTSVDMSFSASVVTTVAAPDLQVTVNSVSYDNGNLTVNYTVFNTGVADSTGVNLHFWLDSQTPPTAGSAGDDQVYIEGIAQDGSHTESKIISAGALESGTLYAYVDPENAVIEADETNNVSAGRAWSGPVQAPQAFDFENGIFPGAMVVSGNAGWQIDSTTASSGTHSIRADTITHNQQACTALSVSGSSSITFDWNVSSESCCDSLRFSIDGVQRASISGVPGWENMLYTGLTLGTHEYEWCYTKDGSVNTGSDTGWVDNIQIY